MTHIFKRDELYGLQKRIREGMGRCDICGKLWSGFAINVRSYYEPFQWRGEEPEHINNYCDACLVWDDSGAPYKYCGFCCRNVAKANEDGISYFVQHPTMRHEECCVRCQQEIILRLGEHADIIMEIAKKGYAV